MRPSHNGTVEQGKRSAADVALVIPTSTKIPELRYADQASALAERPEDSYVPASIRVPHMALIIGGVLALALIVWWLTGNANARLAMFIPCVAGAGFIAIAFLQVANGPQGAAVMQGESTFHPFRGAFAFLVAFAVAWIVASLPFWARHLKTGRPTPRIGVSIARSVRQPAAVPLRRLPPPLLRGQGAVE